MGRDAKAELVEKVLRHYGAIMVRENRGKQIWRHGKNQFVISAHPGDVRASDNNLSLIRRELGISRKDIEDIREGKSKPFRQPTAMEAAIAKMEAPTKIVEAKAPEPPRAPAGFEHRPIAEKPVDLSYRQFTPKEVAIINYVRDHEGEQAAKDITERIRQGKEDLDKYPEAQPKPQAPPPPPPVAAPDKVNEAMLARARDAARDFSRQEEEHKRRSEELLKQAELLMTQASEEDEKAKEAAKRREIAQGMISLIEKSREQFGEAAIGVLQHMVGAQAEPKRPYTPRTPAAPKPTGIRGKYDYPALAIKVLERHKPGTAFDHHDILSELLSYEGIEDIPAHALVRSLNAYVNQPGARLEKVALGYRLRQIQ